MQSTSILYNETLKLNVFREGAKVNVNCVQSMHIFTFSLIIFGLCSFKHC